MSFMHAGFVARQAGSAANKADAAGAGASPHSHSNARTRYLRQKLPPLRVHGLPLLHSLRHLALYGLHHVGRRLQEVCAVAGALQQLTSLQLVRKLTLLHL
jgi:hypothetical protein